MKHNCNKRLKKSKLKYKNFANKYKSWKGTNKNTTNKLKGFVLKEIKLLLKILKCNKRSIFWHRNLGMVVDKKRGKNKMFLERGFLALILTKIFSKLNSLMLVRANNWKIKSKSYKRSLKKKRKNTPNNMQQLNCFIRGERIH